MKDTYLPAIILARSGSKGIKNKNIINFCGKPLIAWSIIQAQKCEVISDVYVSTDGEEIADVAKSYGAKVIWRPEELAKDESSSEDALQHAIKIIKEKCSFSSVIFLQATSPVRRKDDIAEAFKCYIAGGYDSLFSMAVIDDYCLWAKKENALQSISYDYKNRGRRQNRDPLFLENGSIYIFDTKYFEECNNRLFGKIGMYEMPLFCSYEIDKIEDIPICEYFMKTLLK